MKLKCLKTPDIVATKKVALKYLNIKLNSEEIQGDITVCGYRHYNWGADEIDINFNGKYKIKSAGRFIWVDSDTYKNPRYSKIKINRILRKKIFEVLKHRARMFSIKIEHYSSIKKIKWV